MTGTVDAMRKVCSLHVPRATVLLHERIGNVFFRVELANQGVELVTNDLGEGPRVGVGFYQWQFATANPLLRRGKLGPSRLGPLSRFCFPKLLDVSNYIASTIS